MIKASKDRPESISETKKSKKKGHPKESKGIGLFDHIKHIRTVQDPDYFKTLSDVDIKSFNHFMILKSLSMNPSLLEDVSSLFKYFDKIPSPQFYKLLIGLIPRDHPKKFYPWVKIKKNPFNKELIELISTYFEISKKEATEYAELLSLTKNGKLELENLCRDYGLSEKDVISLMKDDTEE